MKEEIKRNSCIRTLDDVLDEHIGKPGTTERDSFDKNVENMVIGIQIQESRKRLNMTQEQLARKVNKKREYISRVENNCGNITLKSLRDIVEIGLGGKLHIEVML